MTAYTRILGCSRADRLALLVVLENMLQAIHGSLMTEKDDPNGELTVQASVIAGQAWQNEPETWTVFDCWLHYSAGPNAVATQEWPTMKRRKEGHGC